MISDSVLRTAGLFGILFCLLVLVAGFVLYNERLKQAKKAELAARKKESALGKPTEAVPSSVLPRVPSGVSEVRPGVYVLFDRTYKIKPKQFFEQKIADLLKHMGYDIEYVFCCSDTPNDMCVPKLGPTGELCVTVILASVVKHFQDDPNLAYASKPLHVMFTIPVDDLKEIF